MKRFDFSLQKLLDLREFYEDQSEMELAKAIAERERIALELNEIAEARLKAVSERTSALNVQDLVAAEHYITRLDIKKEELLKEIAAAELLIEEKRKQMEEAMKNRKVLSRLRDKKSGEYRKKTLQEEDAAIDDIVSQSRPAD